MRLLDKIKQALKKGIAPKDIAAIFGVSEMLVNRVKDRMKENNELS